MARNGAEAEPRRRPRVAAVERSAGRLEARSAHRDDGAGTQRGDADAEAAQQAGGVPDVVSDQESGAGAGPARERGEQQRAMRDALIAGDADGAVDDHGKEAMWRGEAETDA